MPNWCENKLDISVSNAEQLQAVKDKLFSLDANNQLQLDFDLVTPMPESLNVDYGMMEHRAMTLLNMDPHLPLPEKQIEELYVYASKTRQFVTLSALANSWTVADFIQWLRDNPLEQKALLFDLTTGQRCKDNVEKYGHPDWYRWRCHVWGTKWNGQLCHVEEEDLHITVHFDTAWTPPQFWFAELCKAFPDLYMVLAHYEPGVWEAGDFVSDQKGGYTRYIAEDNEIRKFAEDIFGECFDDDE